MDKLQAKYLIESTFNSNFDKDKFRNFAINLLDNLDESKAFTCGNAYVPESFRNYVNSYGRIGKYLDSGDVDIEVLWVNLKKETSLERARTVQRNFVAWYLNGGRGGVTRHNALVAFYNESTSDWRFSFVKLDVSLKQNDNGNVRVVNEYTPAKRFSFLVGELEPNHTAQARLVNLLMKDYPLVSEIEEAFNVEKVSKEFFVNYKELYLQLTENLKNIRENEPSQRINTEFTLKSIKDSDFCKKLMGQLVFLYFIQKKGWLGVKRDAKWGEGDKNFLRHTFERAVSEGKNFFNDYLEHLFYEALADGERDDNWFSLLDCKIPFLNGGLFERYKDYDWVNTDIVFDNSLFSNNNKTKLGDIGTGILDVFDRYNFTVKEDEPLEKEVAVDPEMLGKVFEELLEVQDRKSKGAFYTPREIVHYMCQESLINYLVTTLNIDEESDKQAIISSNAISEKLTKQAIVDFIHHSDKIVQYEKIVNNKENPNSKYQHILSSSINKETAKLIDKALEEIKICDPAIGSGAFPVGMMNEIVRARIALVESGLLPEAQKRTTYEYKRQAIQNSIYGVDIESGAVEIAKLRLWLSLVVDEEDIENIKALPNLDYKIVCGNSLLGVERNLFNEALFKQLEELKPQFFNETRKSEKRRLKKQIDSTIKELTKDETFDFEIYFSEVFHEKGGFDVIIANPPYVGQKGNKEIFDTLKKTNKWKSFYERKQDLYYYFIAKGIDLNNQQGVFSYIIPPYFTTAEAGKNLRQYIVKNSNIYKILNLNGKIKVFDNANVDNLILFLDKREKHYKILIEEPNLSDNQFMQNLYQYESKFSTKNLNSAEWHLFKNKNTFEINYKNTVQLGSICTISPGIQTGCDKVTNSHLSKYNITAKPGNGIYVITDEELNLLNLNKDEMQFIKPFYKNSDIYKYGYNKLKKEWIIITNKIENIDSYPNIKNHLLAYKTILDARYRNFALLNADKEGKWWYMYGYRPNTNFESEKIIFPYRSIDNKFGYSNKDFYSVMDIFYLTITNKNFHIKYILSLINSILILYWLKLNCKKKGNMFELIQKPLSPMPIKKADEQTQNKFISVVDKILAITQTDDYLQNQEKQEAVKEYEKQIDVMVYKLYELTYDEVRFIDKDFELSEQQYNEYCI